MGGGEFLSLRLNKYVQNEVLRNRETEGECKKID